LDIKTLVRANEIIEEIENVKDFIKDIDTEDMRIIIKKDDYYNELGKIEIKNTIFKFCLKTMIKDYIEQLEDEFSKL